MRAESRVVIETVSKATSTSSMVTQQQQQIFTQVQQQQQQQQIQQQIQPVQQFQPPPPAAVAVPIALPVDASKVTVSGNGLHQAAVNQESSFIVDGSMSGLSISQSHQWCH